MPEALGEPEILDSNLEEMLYNPWDLNRVTKVETKIAKPKPNDQPTVNTPERRTADSIFCNSQTQSSADSSNSIFRTLESIRNDPVHSTSSSEILSPELVSTIKAAQQLNQKHRYQI